jgi:hypothetical protein
MDMQEDLSKLTKKELIDRLAQQNKPIQSGAVHYSEHESELAKIDQLAVKSNPYGIPFRETNDHRSITLYTAINKPLPGLHPDNARRTMVRWKKAGYQLYTSKRTEEQVKAYLESPEGIREMAKHKALRDQRHKNSSKSKTEKMMTDIARVTAEAVAGAKK